MKQRIILIFFGVISSFILLELALRLGGYTYLFIQEYRNIQSIKRNGQYRILCLGESTTVFAGGNDWPTQLEEILNKKDNIGIKISVINKGVSGTRTEFIVFHLKDYLDEYRPDMVITMMGVNDGVEAIPYEDVSSRKLILFFKSFRIYKLMKLSKLHIVNKAREINNRIIEKDINARSGKLTSIYIANKKELPERLIKGILHKYQVYIELGKRYKEQAVTDKWGHNKETFNKAERVFKKAIEINPKSEQAYIELGLCYRSQGHNKKIYSNYEKTFKKAIEINPKNEYIYFALAWGYNDDRRYDKSIEMFKKIIEINPKSELAYYGLGQCYRVKGQYAKAIEMFKKNIEINPENFRAYSISALLYEKTKNSKLAEEYFRKGAIIRLKFYNPATRHNYLALKEIVVKRKIKLVCVQYPLRKVEPLKKMIESCDNIIFVDNEKVFREAIKQSSYNKYFIDMFGGDFGHCTRKGNRLLAENIANVILKEYFHK